MAKPNSVKELVERYIRKADDDASLHHVRRVRQWLKNWMFYRGNHFGDFDRNGNWVQLPDSQTEDLRFTDDFYFYVEAKATQWTQSQPEMSINPTATSVKQQRAAANYVKKELEEYRKKWNSSFKQEMAKYAMLSTCYFIHTRPKLSDGKGVAISEFSPTQVEGKGMYLCPKCGWSGQDSPDSKCPECGADLVKSPGQKATAMSPTGVTKMQDIDIDIELVDPMEMKIDSKSRAANITMADWIRRERYVREYEVEAMYEDWASGTDTELSGAAERSDILQYKRALEQSVGGLTYDQKQDEDTCLRRQYWFDKKIYLNFVVPADEKFAGTEFKKGKKLREYYPDGLYVDQINSKCKKLSNEDKNKTWVGCVDTIDPTSPYGRGFSGMVNIQEMIDEGVSLGFAYAMRDALGLQVYDPMMVESSDVETVRVGGALPLKPGAQIEGRGIQQAIINVESKSISSFVMPFFQYVDSKMPHAAGGAYDILGGGEGIGAGAETASGQNQQLQTAAGMIGPALQLRSMVEVIAFKQYLAQVQKFGSDDHFMRIAGEWGQKDAEAFKKSDVWCDFRIEPIQNSEIPRTQMDRRNDVAIAISSGLGDTQSTIMPNIRQYGLEQLRIPIEDDPAEQQKLVAEALLEKMKQASKYVQGMGSQKDPQELAQAICAVAPIVKHRDKDAIQSLRQVFVEFLRQELEQLNIDPLMDIAVNMKLDEIEQFEVASAMDDNAKQTAVNAPMAVAQAKLQQSMQPQQEDAGQAAQAQAEAQTQQKQAETEMEMKADHYKATLDTHAKALDEASAEAQRQHEAGESAAERQQESEQSTKDQAHEERMYRRTVSEKKKAAK